MAGNAWKQTPDLGAAVAKMRQTARQKKFIVGSIFLNF
jgi:hypothetical protein